MVAALIPVASASDLEEQAAAANEREIRYEPVLQGLAAHVRKRWTVMRDFKRERVHARLQDATRAKAMEYSPEQLAQIKEQGGSEIYMGIVSAKCRTATAWLRDTLLGHGRDKPWSLSATPMPEVPEQVTMDLHAIMQQNLEQFYAEGGEPIDEVTLREYASQMRDTAHRQLKHIAEKRVDRMEMLMEDQLTEGGFLKALYQFTDDVATFPYAVMKGPVPRKRRRLVHTPEGGVSAEEVIRDEWERVDPERFYWAPWGDDVQYIPVIEVHDLLREDLEDMIGLEGYDEVAIREVLNNFGFGGSSLWMDDVERDDYGKDYDEAVDDVVHGVQLWDRVPGHLLLEWGVNPEEIDDPDMSYPCEVWMVKDIIIKAVLNYDVLGRKPYYVTSFEKIPGRIDGNGVTDLVMDCQRMCNAAARALANNMGIASGPQVGVNVSRLPNGENITKMHPWKVWQFRSSEYGDNSDPFVFFQPNSNAQELMAVFSHYMNVADEVSGIPRYMNGQHVPGASRTSSGLSMLMSNAGKAIKQVIGNIDSDVLTPLLQRQYHRNLMYADSPAMIGDVQVVAEGAMSLVVKEAEAVRRNEFLRMVLESPVAQEIVGLPGTAELMRESAGTLNSNVDRIVPTREDMIRLQEIRRQEQAMMLQMEEAANLQEDGVEKGGRQSNFVSARPNGR